MQTKAIFTALNLSLLCLFCFIQFSALGQERYFVVEPEKVPVIEYPAKNADTLFYLSVSDSISVIHEQDGIPLPDTVNGMPGQWVKTKSDQGIGYCFDAYLSRFPILKASEYLLSFGQLIPPYVERHWAKVGVDPMYTNDLAGELHLEININYFENNMSLVRIEYMESYRLEWRFEARSSELYYLVRQLFSGSEQTSDQGNSRALDNLKGGIIDSQFQRSDVYHETLVIRQVGERVILIFTGGH